MIKVIYLLLTLLIFPTVSNSSSKINLDDYINSFSWSKRIVLLITSSKSNDLINETDLFFKTNNCENESRNLKYIKIIGDEINKYIIPDRYKKKYGIWLIGYDGGDKSYSLDTSLLKEIHNIIDRMPIRKKEMTEQNERCN